MNEVSGPAYVVLAEAEWTAREAAHHARVDALLAGHRSRATEGRKHPVEDFLFTYYSHRPARLRRWHPGAGVQLAGASALQRLEWRDQARFDGDDSGRGDGDVRVGLDVAAFLLRRGDAVRRTRSLLAATASRPAQLGCFGLHEWAMVYRATPQQLRHAGWPLRLGPAGTDAVVEQNRLRCTHFDAFRFFTEPAVGRNETTLSRQTQLDREQPGCLHATMDLYKWAYKLAPATPSELVLDCLELTYRTRMVDMRAAPYDLADLGVQPIRIETPDGKAEYVRQQRDLGLAAAGLRARLIALCDQLLGERLLPVSSHPQP